MLSNLFHLFNNKFKINNGIFHSTPIKRPLQTLTGPRVTLWFQTGSTQEPFAFVQETYFPPHTEFNPETLSAHSSCPSMHLLQFECTIPKHKTLSLLSISDVASAAPCIRTLILSYLCQESSSL